VAFREDEYAGLRRRHSIRTGTGDDDLRDLPYALKSLTAAALGEESRAAYADQDEQFHGELQGDPFPCSDD
jgi:hypothetical protein